MKNKKIKFEIADQSAIKYVISLNLKTFDGMKILPNNFDVHNFGVPIFYEREKNAYFFKIRFISFSNGERVTEKVVEELQKRMQERFECGINPVNEYILIWGNIKAYVFTNMFAGYSGKVLHASVNILEIMESGVKNEEEMQCVVEMAESAISKEYEDSVFNLSNRGKVTFLVNEPEMKPNEMNPNNENVQPKKAVKIEKTPDIRPVSVNFNYSDESAIEYVMSLDLKTFDGVKILSSNFEHKALGQNILCDKNAKAYFFKIMPIVLIDKETARERESLLKEKFKNCKSVCEYMLICGDARAYIFTNEFHHQEGVSVKVLEIMKSGGEDKYISSMVEGAFKKRYAYCPEFSISIGKITGLGD